MKNYFSRNIRIRRWSELSAFEQGFVLGVLKAYTMALGMAAAYFFIYKS